MRGKLLLLPVLAMVMAIVPTGPVQATVANPPSSRSQSGSGHSSVAPAGMVRRLTAHALQPKPRSTVVDPVGQGFPTVSGANLAPPDSTIAVGPTRVLELTNAGAAVYYKSGQSIASYPLATLFPQAAAGYSLGNGWVLYDPTVDRFYASLAGFGNGSPQGGDLYLNVSQTGDPAGLWYTYKIFSSTTTFCDQPKMAYTSDKIVISCREFNGFSFAVNGDDTFFAPKSLATAGTLTVGAMADVGADTSHQLTIPVTAAFSADGTMNLVSTPYLAYVNGNSIGLISYTVSFPPSLSIVLHDLGSVPVNAFTHPPNAAQLDSSTTLNSNDNRLISAVMQGNELWVSANDGCTPSGDGTLRTCARVIRINVGGMTKQADVEVNNSFSNVLYPSIALDSSGNAFVSATFTDVDPTAANDYFTSTFVAGILATGTSVNDDAVIAAGNGSVREFGSPTRWGGYSGAATDPNQPADVWLEAAYAPNTGVDQSTWGTYTAEATLLPTTFYFAEGYTGTGFNEYLYLFSDGAAATGTASITYYLNGASSLTKTYAMTRGVTTTVNVGADVGINQQVSAVVTLPDVGTAERKLVFNTSWHGSTDIVGVTAPATEWDFAEGSTLAQFSEFLTLQNPNSSAVTANLNYQTDTGAHPTKTLSLPGKSRTTVEVFHGDTNSTSGCIPSGNGANCGVGLGVQGVSVRITTSGGSIIAERPFYVNGFSFGPGTISDGHDAFGANAPATLWNFAEGNTLSDFTEYLTLQNPGASTASVHLGYQIAGRSPVGKTLTVPAQTRVTIPVNVGDTNPNGACSPLTTCGLGPGLGGVSVQVTSNQPIVAERPMYIHHNFGSGMVAGATVVVGSTFQNNVMLFAAASIVSGENDYLTLQNTQGSDASVQIVYFNVATGNAKTITVPASSRVTEQIFTDVTSAPSVFGIIIVSDQPILVEKPTYSTIPTFYGATDTLPTT